MLERPTSECLSLYSKLQALPFVEPFQARKGHNIHEVTRAAMLNRLWQQRREDYVKLSTHAAACFARCEEPEWQIERIYHALVANPDAGTEMLKHRGLTWHSGPYFAYNLVYALAESAMEHADAGRLTGLGRAYAHFLLGEINRIYYHHTEAVRNLEQALQTGDSDKSLAANCIKALGAYYAETEDYVSALQAFEEAAARYRAIGLHNDEAGAINCIADLYERQGEPARAIEAYTRALEICAGPMWYRNRASLYIKLRDADSAERDIEAAARLQPEHPYLSFRRGDLARLRGDYRAAEAHYRAALERLPHLNGAQFGLGQALFCQRRPEEALAALRAGLEDTHAANELKDTIEEMEALQPDLPGLAEALALLRTAREHLQLPARD